MALYLSNHREKVCSCWTARWRRLKAQLLLLTASIRDQRWRRSRGGDQTASWSGAQGAKTKLSQWVARKNSRTNERNSSFKENKKIEKISSNGIDIHSVWRIFLCFNYLFGISGFFPKKKSSNGIDSFQRFILTSFPILEFSVRILRYKKLSKHNDNFLRFNLTRIILCLNFLFGIRD